VGARVPVAPNVKHDIQCIFFLELSNEHAKCSIKVQKCPSEVKYSMDLMESQIEAFNFLHVFIYFPLCIYSISWELSFHVQGQ
jgi:hypothetical protein